MVTQRARKEIPGDDQGPEALPRRPGLINELRQTRVAVVPLEPGSKLRQYVNTITDIFELHLDPANPQATYQWLEEVRGLHREFLEKLAAAQRL